jgi:electron transfer flavoprotein alpha subunit
MVSSVYGVDDETKAIWVFLEHQRGELEPVSSELIYKGRQLANQMGWQLCGFLLGFEVSHLAEQAIAYGADQIILGQHDLLTDYTVDAYAQLAFNAIADYKPSIFLFGATHNGRDLAGRLAVRLRTGLNADCTNLQLDPENGVLVCEVSGFGGGVLALIEMQEHRPQMATVRPGVFLPGEADHTRHGKVIHLSVDLDKETIHTRIIEQVIGESLDLTQVQVLVAGGRGIDGRFDLLSELANILGGEVGATRPPVDEGHIERERQIGQTGVVCRPKLALCCGISGAFHFIVGVQDADIVIAINSDPDAPIFDHADYCIVADTHQLIPALLEELRRIQVEFGDPAIQEALNG